MKTSYYYKYNFVSPEPLYAKVKEELKSYFQTGVIDDVLFPKYTERALGLLGKSSYKIEEGVFRLEGFETTLPDNFHAVRELWLATSSNVSYKMPNARYEQSSVIVNATRNRCDNGFCPPDEIKVTYKTTGTLIQSFKCHYLLKPGNLNALHNCALESWNIDSTVADTFDIRGNKLVTNFPEGTLYMVYYVKDYDESEYQLIPDNDRIQEYLEYYLKYKCFETVYNNISDETLNQVQNKMVYYEQKADQAVITAKNEIKMQTVQKQIMATKNARNRLRKFNIS